MFYQALMNLSIKTETIPLYYTPKQTACQYILSNFDK